MKKRLLVCWKGDMPADAGARIIDAAQLSNVAIRRIVEFSITPLLALAAIWVLVAIIPASAAASLPAATKQIAITFDDLPYANRKAPLEEIRGSTAKILWALKQHRAKAIGFVNEDRLPDTGRIPDGLGILKMWLNAGMELGNHNYGHVGLHTTPLSDYEAAVLRGERYTRPLLASRGQKLRYYRHPFTQTGPTAAIKAEFEKFLSKRGYAIAPFTIEHDDYVFSLVYDDALARGDVAQAARIRDEYLHHLDEALDAFETMSTELFRRQIAHILLIHANRLNADTLDDTLNRLEARGYSFVPLESALRDPAYRSPDGYVGPAGPSWLLRWARGLRVKTTVGGQPDPAPWVQQRYEQLAAQQAKVR